MNNNDINYKEILEKIVEEEKKEHGLTFGFHYIGRVTYYKKMDEIYKKKFTKVKKIKEILDVALAASFLDTNKNFIVIFSNECIRKIYPLNLTKLIFCLYHEIGHARHEKELKLSNYDDLLIYCDIIFSECNHQKYSHDANFHDSLAHEICADMYALKKTKDFFQKNKQYKLDEKFLKRQEKKNERYYNQLDLTDSLDWVIENYQELEFDKTFFGIFLNPNGTFKNLDEIFSNERFQDIDERIVLNFFNTKAFIKGFNIKFVSDESKKYLYKLLRPRHIELEKIIIQRQQKAHQITSRQVIEKILFSALIAIPVIFTKLLLKHDISEIINEHPDELIIVLFVDYQTIKLLVNKISEKYRLSYDEKEIKEFMDKVKESVENNELKKKG